MSFEMDKVNASEMSMLFFDGAIFSVDEKSLLGEHWSCVFYVHHSTVVVHTLIILTVLPFIKLRKEVDPTE